MVWAGIRGRSITTRVRSPPGSSLSRSGSPSRGQRASARTGLLSSRLERLFPSPRASRPSWDESPPRRSPFFFVGNGPQLSLFVGNGPQLSWATAPNSLSSWATAPNSRGQRPPTLSLFAGDGPQLSWATAPTLARVGTGPLSRWCGPPPWRAVSHLSSGRPLRPFGWTKLAPTPRGPGPASSWDGYSPRASLVVSLASAGSSRDRAKPGLACTLAVAFSLRGRVALRTRCAR